MRHAAQQWIRGRRGKDQPWGMWHLVERGGRSRCGKFNAYSQYRLERSKSEPGRPCKSCITAAFFELERAQIIRSVYGRRSE